MATRFQVTIRCQVCQTRYKRVMEAEDVETLDRIPDPPCPQCKKAQKVRRAKFDGTAPAIGGSLVVRAVDQTAEIAMANHGLSDLRDFSSVKEGESMAPKLAPHLQAMADGMFDRRQKNPNAGVAGMPPQFRQRHVAPGIMGLPTRAVISAAINGRFNTSDSVNPVAIQHQKRDRPPVQIVAGDGVKGR